MLQRSQTAAGTLCVRDTRHTTPQICEDVALLRLPYATDRKWFLQALGHDGLNNLLLAYEDKSAEAVCTFAYSAGPGHEPVIFQGRTTVGRRTRLSNVRSHTLGENRASAWTG